MARKKARQASSESTRKPAGAKPRRPAPRPKITKPPSGFWAKATARQVMPVTNSFRRYSRFVGRAKLILPLSAAALMVAVAAWPYFSVSFSKMHAPIQAPSQSEIAEARMISPHYIGTDRQQRPFSITARIARQTGDNDDLMALDAPHAELRTNNGAQVSVTGDSGIYQSQAHFLDLSGNVTMSQAKGYNFHTDTARVDLQNGSTEGHDPVTGEGPGGTIKADGFQAERGGEAILFTGHADLIVNAAGQKS